MKKLSVFLCGLLMAVTILAGPAAAATTITGITLWGGEDYGTTNWYWNGQGWTTHNTGWWVLGVSSTPNGSLDNKSDTTISVPFNHDYWLYAEPTDLGMRPKVKVTTDTGEELTAIFGLSGAPGNETTWTLISGDSEIQLGWASGTANKVGSGNQMTPIGNNDFYLHLQAGTPVPVPTTIFLLGSGILGLAGVSRRKK